MARKIEVFCRFQFEATHSCPSEVCPEELPFLCHEHRHIFHVRCVAPVKHDNRDIEFIKMKHDISNYCCARFEHKNIGNMSCEQIAEQLINFFPYLSRVTVSEDGENGATVTSI